MENQSIKINCEMEEKKHRDLLMTAWGLKLEQQVLALCPAPIIQWWSRNGRYTPATWKKK